MDEFHKTIESCGNAIRTIVITSVVILLGTYLVFLFILVSTDQEIKAEQASLISVLSFSVIISLGLSFKGVLSALGTLRQRLTEDSGDDNKSHKEAIIKIEISKMTFLTKALKWLSPVYLLIFITVFIMFGIVNINATYYASTVSMMAFLGLFIIMLPGVLIAQTGGKLSLASNSQEEHKYKWLIASSVVIALAGGGGVLGFAKASRTDASDDYSYEVLDQMEKNKDDLKMILYQLEQLNIRSATK